MTKLLVVEHSKSVRNNLRERLEFEGYAIRTAEDVAAAAQAVDNEQVDMIIVDDISSLPPTELPFIVLSASSTLNSAVDSFRRGAVDFLTKPVDMNRLLGSIRNCVGDTEPSEGTGTPRTGRRGNRPRRTTVQHAIEPIVGQSEQIVHVRHLIDRVAPSQARVLITGENGTGKELVARWLHAKSTRADAPFVEVNCAAIPSELIESELFGHERGAFTSAVKQRKGKFEQADGGTLFMDEVGDMSLSAQAKVLRALQERKISRVGSDRDIDVDVRVIAATNKNLREEIAKGTFREDLYHRLSVIVISVPPLRSRFGDIPMLVNHFISNICTEYNIPAKPIEAKAVEALTKMRWSGNIRELRNVIERLIILSGSRITLSDIELYC
ncbi:MAG: sigma-54-dependent Fis family transcriptional regulator [Alistipes sp.]|nr:sigma-54-dependent Fis family transcriptional regulator [Alistipes sp.]